jgi:hypothetical protein
VAGGEKLLQWSRRVGEVVKSCYSCCPYLFYRLLTPATHMNASGGRSTVTPPWIAPWPKVEEEQ